MIRLQDFKQVVEVNSTKECNGWLEKGWKLAKIIDKPEGTIYVLGLVRE